MPRKLKEPVPRFVVLAMVDVNKSGKTSVLDRVATTEAIRQSNPVAAEWLASHGNSYYLAALLEMSKYV